MALADISRLPSFARDAARALGAHFLEAGLTQAFLAPVFGVGERLDDSLRAPMRIWQLRQQSEPRAVLARAFMFADGVPQEACTDALGGDALFRTVVTSGLLVESALGYLSPFRLDIAFDLYFFSDPLSLGGDAVMGPSATTGQLALAARPAEKVTAVLDLGCGAGVLAIALSDRASRVVATDINPRALVFTELNAALNGITNVGARTGDLFEPVSGERFDLVVSQPPFVGLPEKAGRPSFLFGGARGDELALRAMGEVAGVLAPGGRALFLVDFPVDGGASPEARVREAVGPGPHVLVASSADRLLEDHCTLYAAGMEPTLGPTFAETALAMRDHFKSLDVRALSLSVVVIEGCDADCGFTHRLDVKPFAMAPLSSRRLRGMMKALSVLAGGVVAAGACRFAFADGVSFDPIVGVGTVVRPSAESSFLPWGVNDAVGRELQILAASRDLFGALECAANPESMMKTLVQGVLRGVVELVP